MKRNAPSKRKTKILQKAIDNSPQTTKNVLVFHYNFSNRDYEIHNPSNLQMSTKFPMRKLKLVRRDIKTNVKDFPRPRFERQYLCIQFLIKSPLIDYFRPHRILGNIFNNSHEHILRAKIERFGQSEQGHACFENSDIHHICDSFFNEFNSKYTHVLTQKNTLCCKTQGKETHHEQTVQRDQYF